MRNLLFVLLFSAGAVAGTAATYASLTPHQIREEQAAKTPQKRSAKEVDESPTIRMSAEQMAEQSIAIAKAAGGTLTRHLTVPGTIVVAANHVARVPARVVGTVAEMRKQLGDRVEVGEVVAVLDSREVADAKSEYLTAVVNLELQQTNYERARALWERRISAEAQYLQAQATFSETQLRADLARQKLSALGLDATVVAANAKQEEKAGSPSSLRRYELRSPLAGRVIDRKVDVGTAVGKEGDPAEVYTIADLSVLWADISVLTSDLDLIKEGAAVSITPANGETDKRSEGKAVFVSPVLSPDTRSARVIAELPNEAAAWRPGAFATAEIEIARDEVAVLVPRSALQKIDGNTVVFVRTENGFERREIKLGRGDDDSIEVTAGLQPGDEIVIKNSFLLKAELGKAGASDDD